MNSDPPEDDGPPSGGSAPEDLGPADPFDQWEDATRDSWAAGEEPAAPAPPTVYQVLARPSLN